MAYVLGDKVDVEIKSALFNDQSANEAKDDEIKRLFKNHKKLLIKHLN